MDVKKKLTEAGYTFEGRSYVGDRYRRGNFTVYHSGHLLMFVRDGGMIRSFPEDRLCFFSVEEMERQTCMILRRFDMKEETASYDYGRKF